MNETPDMNDLESLGIRVGTIVRADHNTGAREPAYRLWIDIGAEAPVQSSAKITAIYEPEDLINRQVVVVTGDGVVLLRADDVVPPGSLVS